MVELKTEFLFELKANVADRHVVGDSGRGNRVIVEVTGGTFEGPSLAGSVLPFGADFAQQRSDGVIEVDVRIILRTSDGAEIYMTYSGLIHEDSLGPLEESRASERYFRTTPRFETDAESYRWLTRILAVGVNQGRTEPGVAHYRVYAVL